MTVEKQKQIEPRERMKVTQGPAFKVKLSDNCGSLYIYIGLDPDGPCEVFVIKGKSGGCVGAYAEAVGRLASIALASGVPPEHIIKQLKGIRCPHPKLTNDGTILSCPDGIGRILERFLKRDEPKETPPHENQTTVAPTEKKRELSVIELGEKPECPECGEVVVHESGCLICKRCGWSKCF